MNLWNIDEKGWQEMWVTSFIETRDGTVYECKTLAEFRETHKALGYRNIKQDWKIRREVI